MRLLPPLGDGARIKAHCGAYEPARDDVRLCLAVNRDRVQMENLGYLASSEGPMVGAEDLGDRCWI